MLGILPIATVPGGEKGGLFSHPICESSPIGSIGRLLERNDS